LALAGSRWVAGWVACFRGEIRLLYGVLAKQGSRCSIPLNKLHMCKRGVKGRVEPTIGTTCYTCYPKTYEGEAA
jgi:hypothetical protein